MDGVRIILFLLIIIHVLPIAITQLLILEYPFAERKNGIIIQCVCTVANVLLNVLVVYEIIMYSKLDPLDFFNLSCSYQDISKLAASNIISLVFSFLIGIGICAWVSRLYKEEYFFRFSGKSAVLVLLIAFPVMLGYYYGHTGTSYLAINEICRRTTAVDPEEYSEDVDVIGDEVCYVSVINKGSLTCELDEMYLSENAERLRQRQFSQDLAIEPGETYQFYMASVHSLDIKKGGGSTVYLSDKFGKIVDSIEVPALEEDESYKNMGAGWQVIRLAEPKETIAAAEISTVPAPSFSHEGGFYAGAFELALTAQPGTTVYYTLDSSDPTVESAKYSQPIHVYDPSGERNLHPEYTGEAPVDKCFVVRAVAVDSEGNTSDIITNSYFVNQDKYRGDTILSLVSDPDGLFGEDGIYVTGKEYNAWYSDALAKAGGAGEIDESDAPKKNYQKKGIEWERKSNLEVLKNTDLILSQPVGIRIQGNAYRAAPLKRFSIFAREEYSFSEFFDVNLIGDYPLHSLLLRPGQAGNLHVVSQLIGKGRDVVTTDFIEVDVFLNGEFWYRTYLYEKYNEKNFSQKYDITKNNIVIYKSWGEVDKNSLEAGKNPQSSLENFINSHDLSNNENYLKYNEILDIQSYIDWYCINTFLLNLDYSEHANTVTWHTVIAENEKEGDARWRFGLYDMDIGGWSSSRTTDEGIPYYKVNPFTTNDIAEWPIYAALRRNELFRKQFVLTFMDLIHTNFSVENTTAILETLGIKNEVYREFFENRAAYIVPYVAEEFGLTGTQGAVTLSSNISGTPVTLNTISPALHASDSGFSWTGSYFTDYPVTVTANAPGFSHWEVTANGSVETFTDTTIEVPVTTGGVQIHAAFK